jgi:hypothetical protein
MIALATLLHMRTSARPYVCCGRENVRSLLEVGVAVVAGVAGVAVVRDHDSCQKHRTQFCLHSTIDTVKPWVAWPQEILKYLFSLPLGVKVNNFDLHYVSYPT